LVVLNNRNQNFGWSIDETFKFPKKKRSMRNYFNIVSLEIIIVMQKKIGVLTIAIVSSGISPLLNLMKILLNLSNNSLYIITGGEGSKVQDIEARIHSINIEYQCKRNPFSRIVSYIFTQIRMSISIIQMSKNVDIWLFFFGGELLILPVISAKITRKTVVMLFSSSELLMSESRKSNFNIIIRIISKINFNLFNKLILYSPALISEWNLEPYFHKIIIAHRHFLNFDRFTVTTPLSNRSLLIGYIGRLSREKGVQNFTLALPAIIGSHKDLRVFIGGDGELKDSIVDSLKGFDLTDKVNLPGWISHEDLPSYLNQLHLLIIPSYTEGLPNIMLEAMACGTPVLVTPVGAIPDVIRDGETGFIMEDNSPKCIAINVTRALGSPDLERVAERGRKFVEENYTFESVVGRWKTIFEEI
jgi:glycosyltransferase involved in cell wall biosynthesis